MKEVCFMNYSNSHIRVLTADVVVVGGGTAGVFAAIAAAKSGADTVLIEKNSVPGGTVTVAGVNFPGLFFAWGKQIIDGPCWESVERTIRLGGAVMPQISYKPRYHSAEQILLNRFVYTSVLFQMCKEAGVRVFCNCMASDAWESERGITVLVTGKEGLFAVKAGAAVDASGDANLATLAGFATEKSEVCQPATLQNRLSGYASESIADETKAEIREKFSAQGFPDHISAETLIHYLSIRKIDMHVSCDDASTSVGRTALDQRAFEETLKVYRFLRSIKGLEGLEIDYAASETGVRETRRIVGETTVTAEDYIRGVFYPDSVCYAFYPIDRHVMTGIEQEFHKENVVSKIPYSALIPKGAEYLLCAGRCVSSDTYANSALRVEAPCMAMGQAAGCAAALAAKNASTVRAVDHAQLCAALKRIGAIVPSKKLF